MRRPSLNWYVVALAVALALGLRSNAAPASAATALPEQPGAPIACPARQAGANVHHAGLVVTFGPADSRGFCIAFSEDAISGIELLRRSGLSFVSAAQGGLGDAVCSIEGVGCDDPGDCFCRCRGGTCEYWSYYERAGGAWRYLQVGPSTRMLHDGDVDGWAWGRGSVAGGAQPDAPAGLCASPTPPPTPVPTPTHPRPQPPRPTADDGHAPALPARPAGATPGAGGTTAPGPALSATPTSVGGHAAATATRTPNSSVRGERLPGRPTGPADGSASSPSGGDGGSGALPLVLFGIVGAALLGACGVFWYRRRAVDG